MFEATCRTSFKIEYMIDVVDLEEMTLHAEAWLSDNGHHQHEIDSITHTDGTNVWTVVAKVPDGELVLLLNHDNGSLMDFQKRKHLHVSVTDGISITDHVSAHISMYFELDTKLDLDTNHEPTGIKLIPDEKDARLIKAFVMRLPNTSKEETDKASMRANRLVNYMSAMTGKTIGHKRQLLLLAGSCSPPPSMEIPQAKAHGLPDDLDSPLLVQLTQPLHYFKNGFKALHNYDFAQAVRWFHMIVENDKFVDSEEYRALRNGLSHKEMGKATCDDLKKYFGIGAVKNSPLNLDDPNVQEVLCTKSHELYKIAKRKIECEMGRYVAAHRQSSSQHRHA